MKRTFTTLSLATLMLCAGLSLSITSNAAIAQDHKAESKAEAKAQSKVLVIGDKAPEIKVAKWVKGSEIKNFEAGKIYVVEFWATWCGPCKKSIPHLTELAKEYKDKVTFAGVSVWESDEDYVDTVEKFVKKMGDKMDYNVAIDDKFGNDGTMAKTWMKAAMQDGIPSAFVVNGEGKIAWIGHPMEMEAPLKEIVAGKWDLAKAASEAKIAAEKAEKERAEMEMLQKEYMPVRKAMQDGDLKAVVTELDKLIAKHPDMATRLNQQKFAVLLQSDEPAAYTLAKDLVAKDLKDDAMGLNEIAWTILDTKQLKSPDYDLAYAAAKRAAELTKNEDGMILDSYALACFKKGEVDQAIEIQTKAVELVKKSGQMDADGLSELQDRLAEFKKAKK